MKREVMRRTRRQIATAASAGLNWRSFAAAIDALHRVVSFDRACRHPVDPGTALFTGGPGRVTRPDNFRSLMTDLEQWIFGRFDDSTWFYPGHGKDSTLGAERPHLGEWWARGW